MCASAILLAVVSITGQGAYADTRGGRPVPRRVERDLRHFKTVATDNVMDVLAIRPGMTILDIGAGTGQFAFEFAGKLKGTGRVFAADINDDCIDYIKKEAERRGLGNLHSVLVKKDGVDPFYGKYKYDLITVFHVSMTYEDQGDYFRELRGFLAEDGRLVLILYKIPTPFSPADFTVEFPGLIRELSQEPPESPFYKMLRESTRKKIGDLPGKNPPGEVRGAIVEDFNGALADSLFAAGFLDGSGFGKDVRFSPEERRYADWFSQSYAGSGFRKPDGDVRSGNTRVQRVSGYPMFSTINKLLIVQRFRKYLKRDGLFRSGFSPPVRDAFEKAGYKVDREYTDLIPFEDMIVFSSP